MRLMSRWSVMAASVLGLCLFFAVSAARAESSSPPPLGKTPALVPFEMADGGAIVERLLPLAQAFLQEYVDIRARVEPGGEAGTATGSLHLKLYPQGRSQGGEAFETDAWFKAAPGTWSFGFRANEPPPHPADLDQYL